MRAISRALAGAACDALARADKCPRLFMMIPAAADVRAEPKGFLSRVVSTVKSVAVVEWNLYLLCEGANDDLSEAPHFVAKKAATKMTVPKVRGRGARGSRRPLVHVTLPPQEFLVKAAPWLKIIVSVISVAAKVTPRWRAERGRA